MLMITQFIFYSAFTLHYWSWAMIFSNDIVTGSEFLNFMSVLLINYNYFLSVNLNHGKWKDFLIISCSCSRHDMTGAYNVTLAFRHSVIPSSLTFLSLSQQLLHTFNSNLIFRCTIGMYRSSFWIWFLSNDFWQSCASWRDAYIKLIYYM